MTAAIRRWSVARAARSKRAGLVVLLVMGPLLPFNASARGAHAVDWWWLFGDEVAPRISQFSPPAGEPTADARQRMIFYVADPWRFGLRTSRLVPDSLLFVVDGNDRAADVRFEPAGLATFIPAIVPRRGWIIFEPSADLADGERSIQVQMADRAGNVGTLEKTLLVDTTPPEVAAIEPDPTQPVTDLAAQLLIGISDAGAGVDWDSLEISVNGEPLDAPQIDRQSGELLVSPADQWPQGEVVVEVTVADRLGNAGSSSITYLVMPDVGLAAGIRAVPSSGPAPLQVTLSPVVTTDTAIETYRWDFNGDGSFDRNEPIGRDQSFTFERPGTYTVTLQVMDSRGETAEGSASIEVTNQPPEVSAEAQPSNGAPPLQVTFSATAQDSDGISQYEWDFQGDGTYDLTSTTPSATYSYSEQGTFQPQIRVADTLGGQTVVAVPTVAVRVVAGAPTVTAAASPAAGDAPLSVSFDATASDPDGLAISQWVWDFDGDGTEDFTSTDTGATTFEFTAPGTYYPRVTVTAEDGDTSTDVVEVVVNPSFSLSLSTDTIDTELGEAVDVQTELGGDTRVSLVIENPARQVVRTLVPWQLRQAGTYTDTWDGTADDGNLVSEGEYRAVLLYEIDGAEQRFDLGPTTGGREYNPSRNGLPRQFAPFGGDPLDVTFTLPEASEVTAFVGRYNVNSRLVTFHQRRPLGRGSHTILWHGESADGELIHPPPGDQFLFGIFAFSLPDNAVFVRSGVHVTNLSAFAPIFDPSGVVPDGWPTRSQVRFTLSRAGDVELTAYDADTGALVDRRLVEDLPAGENVIPWDARTASGDYLAPGAYRLGITGIDERGSTTPTLYTMQRIYY